MKIELTAIKVIKGIRFLFFLMIIMRNYYSSKHRRVASIMLNKGQGYLQMGPDLDGHQWHTHSQLRNQINKKSIIP